jgi:hypothetical protein
MAVDCTSIQYSRTAMRREPLPDFATPSTRQLRELWRKYPDDEAVRSACLETERMRRVRGDRGLPGGRGAVLEGRDAQHGAAYADGGGTIVPGISRDEIPASARLGRAG